MRRKIETCNIKKWEENIQEERGERKEEGEEERLSIFKPEN